MYIDTHTKDTMRNSICKIFNIEVRELDELFIKAKKELSTSTFIDRNKLDSIFNKLFKSTLRITYLTLGSFSVEVLQTLFEFVLENPEKNKKEELLLYCKEKLKIQ